MTIVKTTQDQQQRGQEAANLRYEDGLRKQDRPGWTGGKCPKNEYFGILGELGAANYLGIPDSELCLYSVNTLDYRKPDLMNCVEVKCGRCFTTYDIAKGARIIMWVRPVVKGSTYYCRFEHCKAKVHLHLTGDVEILGWNYVTDDFLVMGDRRYVKEMRDPALLRGLDWPVAA